MVATYTYHEKIINSKQFKNEKIILTLILSFAIISCETPTQANSDFPLVVDSSKYEEIANARMMQ